MILHLRLYGVAALYAGLAVALFAAGIVVKSDVRPDDFSFLLFPLVLAGLERLRLGRAFPYAGPAAFCLFAVWANLHAAFVYGLAAAACYALGAIRDERGRRRQLLVVLACSFAGCLLNPYGAGLFAVLLRHAADSNLLRGLVLEWNPSDPRNAYLWPYFGVLLALGTAYAAALFKRRPVPAAHLLLAGNLAWLSLRHTRLTPYFVLAAIPMLACRWRTELAALKPAAPVRAGAWALGILLALYFAFFAPWRFPREGLRRSEFPERTASFLAENARELAGLKMFNPYGWGGFLAYRLYPDFRIFMDGRYLFANLLREQMEATRDPGAWNAFLDAKGLDLAVLKRASPDIWVEHALPGGVVEKTPRPYYIFFMPQERWALVHFDSLALVFARRAAAEPGWLRRNAYEYYHPGDREALERAIRGGVLPAPGLRAELCRWQRENGPNEETRGLLSLLGPTSSAPGCAEPAPG